VRKLIGHIPTKRRQLSTWQHVEKTLQECAAGDDALNISVALQIVLGARAFRPFTRVYYWSCSALLCYASLSGLFWKPLVGSSILSSGTNKICVSAVHAG